MVISGQQLRHLHCRQRGREMAVLETTGGVPVLEGGLLGLLMVGLSQEEKKSSAGSPAGVDVPSTGVPATSSVMTTSPGLSSASLAALLFNSSLYLLAAFEVYLTLASLLLSAAVPPFDWKNLVADSLPPTLKVRSCSHCQISRLVERTKEMWTPRFRWLDEQSRHRYTPNGTDDHVGFFCPQSKHICGCQYGGSEEGGRGALCWIGCSSASRRFSETGPYWHSLQLGFVLIHCYGKIERTSGHCWRESLDNERQHVNKCPNICGR